MLYRCWQRLTNMNRTHNGCNTNTKRMIQRDTQLKWREQRAKKKNQYTIYKTVAVAISISLENLWIIFSIEFGWIHTTKTSTEFRFIRSGKPILRKATRFSVGFDYIKRINSHIKCVRLKGIRLPSTTIELLDTLQLWLVTST